MKEQYITGLDFGTESARSIIVAISTGELVQTSVVRYTHGVIDLTLPGNKINFLSRWVFQHSMNWINALEQSVREVVSQSGVPIKVIVGLCIDFTSSTVLPAFFDGSSLCLQPVLRKKPQAWPKPWKQHATQKQADHDNVLTHGRGERWLLNYSGKKTSDWLLPKTIQILKEGSEVHTRIDVFIVGVDWVTWQLTGNLFRNVCTDNFKVLWYLQDGYPSREFLSAPQPDLADLYVTKVSEKIRLPGQLAGRLVPVWAERLGLPIGIPVALHDKPAEHLFRPAVWCSIGAMDAQSADFCACQANDRNHFRNLNKGVYSHNISGCSINIF